MGDVAQKREFFAAMRSSPTAVFAGEPPPEAAELNEKSIRCQRWLGGLLNHYYRRAA